MLDRPTSGSYWLNGQEVSRLSADRRAKVRNRNIGFVFQSFNLLPRSSAVEQVRMPLVYAAKPWSNREERRRAVELLERVGLGQRFDHEPSQLSGGQQQRVAISRALVNHPPILLADEPTGNLDSRTSEEILQMFQRSEQGGGDQRHPGDARSERRPPCQPHHLYPRRPDRQRCSRPADGRQLRPAMVMRPANGQVDGNGLSSGNGNGYGNGMGGDGWPCGGRPIRGIRRLETSARRRCGRFARASRGRDGTFSRNRRRQSEPVAKQSGSARARAAVRLLPRTFGIAFKAIRRNAFRSILTTLGIIIGIAAVIAMMEIGQGTTKMQQQTIASMGANILLVMPGTATSGGVSYGSGSTVTLTPQDGEAIAQECPAVSNVAPVVRREDAGRLRRTRIGCRCISTAAPRRFSIFAIGTI